MIKAISTLTILLISTLVFSQHKGNYILVINKDTLLIDLDKEQQFKTTKGKRLTILLSQPETLTYSDEMISFSHHKSLSVSNSIIDEEIEQCVGLESTGNGFLVQKYKNFNPSLMTEMMLEEITKESINYGYTKTEKPFKKILSSGQTVEGIHAVLTYGGKKEVYTVATYGAKDEGIVIITMLVSDGYKGDEIISLFWDTLKIH